MIASRPASCMPDACFCEAIRDGAIMQPANSFSSLAFVIAGLVILVRGRNAESRLFALVLIFLGVASAYYHATLTFGGQFGDVLGMYLIATLALAHAVNRRWKISGVGLAFGYIVANIALAALLYWIPVVRRAVFAVILVFLLALERSHIRELSRAAVILAIAFTIWIADYYRIACAPSSLIQGHAVWHLLGAAAGWFLYRDYLLREERRVKI